MTPDGAGADGRIGAEPLIGGRLAAWMRRAR